MQALNALAPEAGDVRLGTLLIAMIAAHNQLQADHNTLRAQYQGAHRAYGRWQCHGAWQCARRQRDL
jgi:hypothetical protein